MPHAVSQGVLGLLLAVLFTAHAAAANVAVDTDAEGLALQGYDPVAYFTEGKPVAGESDLVVEHDGASYRFASFESRDMFAANPEKYAPKYGGYCAFGTTFQQKVPGDPQAFRIVDDKLYINSSPDILKRWSNDIPGNVEKADRIWPEIMQADPADL
jgi:YHS domain-containing protein